MQILICDDHPLIRQGLKQTLSAEARFRVAAEASNAEEALALLSSATFDLLILDVNLPDRNGIDVLREIRKTHPSLPVLVLSLHTEYSVAMRAIKAGATGYLCKESAPEELILAVRKVGSGGSYLSTEMENLVLQHLSGRSGTQPHDALSDREYQVMCQLAAGKSISQIAETLQLSPNTVSTYRARVLEKMGLTNNSELTRYAVAHQLIN